MGFIEGVVEFVSVAFLAMVFWAIGVVIYRAGQRSGADQFGTPRKIGETWVSTRRADPRRKSNGDLY